MRDANRKVCRCPTALQGTPEPGPPNHGPFQLEPPRLLPSTRRVRTAPNAAPCLHPSPTQGRPSLVPQLPAPTASPRQQLPASASGTRRTTGQSTRRTDGRGKTTPSAAPEPTRAPAPRPRPPQPGRGLPPGSAARSFRPQAQPAGLGPTAPRPPPTPALPVPRARRPPGASSPRRQQSPELRDTVPLSCAWLSGSGRR